MSEGGLGSVMADTLVVSPCGRRAAWTDTDGRIVAMTIPPIVVADSADRRRRTLANPAAKLTVLPEENESGEPMIGTNAYDLVWSPGGRYLAVSHTARNQFRILTVVDCGDPDEGRIVDPDKIRAVQATSDRFNSEGAYWGRTSLDLRLETIQKATLKAAGIDGVSADMFREATTLYYLSDRDVLLSGRTSPWGTRAPSPHFERRVNVYALPLKADGDVGAEEEESMSDRLKKMYGAPYVGGGAAEVVYMREAAFEAAEEEEKEAAEAREREEAAMNEKKEGEAAEGEGTRRRRRGRAQDDDVEEVSTSASPSFSPSQAPAPVSPYPSDKVIDFGKPVVDSDVAERFPFARRAYRMSNIPTANYVSILSQLLDDASFVMMELTAKSKGQIKLMSVGDFPSDSVEEIPINVVGFDVVSGELSTDRKHLHLTFVGTRGSAVKVVPNTAEGVIALLLKDADKFSKNLVDDARWSLSVWPSLEYQHMYADAWRLLRDYFYDRDMTGIDWPAVFARYRPLVTRCAKREELDDVLRLMASELSALHVFVYGGEYGSPLHGDHGLEYAHQVGSLGATLRKAEEWAGYEVTTVPELDPDFGLMDGSAIYSPLSDRTLRLSGQRGLMPGDVVVGVNGESVANVPDLGMLLRGTAGRSVRLDVLRVSSGPTFTTPSKAELRKGRRMKATTVEDGDKEDEERGIMPEPVIVVPISPHDAAHLRYSAWEWSTRQSAKALAAAAGFTVGYLHLRDMSGAPAEDAFVRGFYPDYDKQGLIVDVVSFFSDNGNNCSSVGGNIYFIFSHLNVISFCRVCCSVTTTEGISTLGYLTSCSVGTGCIGSLAQPTSPQAALVGMSSSPSGGTSLCSSTRRPPVTAKDLPAAFLSSDSESWLAPERGAGVSGSRLTTILLTVG